MSDTQSSGKGSHDLFKEIDDLCAEIDAGLANQLSDETVNKLRTWVRRAPRKIDECFLAVYERKGLPESCIAWLSTNGYTVVSVKPREVRGREALISWRSELRNLSALSVDVCVFIRGLNLLTVGEQQALWSSWVEAQLPSSKMRFAYSFVPWTEEFDSLSRNDVWSKLADRTTSWIEHA